MSAPLVLISHALCPYVQRAAIVLAEKGVAFERRDIDLAHKPDWFLAVSPLGRLSLLARSLNEAPSTTSISLSSRRIVRSETLMHSSPS